MSGVHYFMRVCVCTHVCAGANAHVYMSYGSQRTISGIIFRKAIELPLTQVSHCNLGAHQLGYTYWPVHPRDYHVFTSSLLEFKYMPPCLAFLHGFWASNSSLHVFNTSTLLTEQSF